MSDRGECEQTVSYAVRKWSLSTIKTPTAIQMYNVSWWHFLALACHWSGDR